MCESSPTHSMFYLFKITSYRMKLVNLQVFSHCGLSHPSRLQCDTWRARCHPFRLDVNPAHVTWKGGIWAHTPCDDHLWRTHAFSFTFLSAHSLNSSSEGTTCFGTQIMDYFSMIAQHQTTCLSSVINFSNWESNYICFYFFGDDCLSRIYFHLPCLHLYTAINNFNVIFASLADANVHF